MPMSMSGHLGFTALYMAAQENHKAIVKLLLNKGADPLVCTNDGFQALDVAKQLGNHDVVSILTRHAFHPLQSTKYSSLLRSNSLSKVHAAAKRNDVLVINALCHDGFSINSQTKAYQTEGYNGSSDSKRDYCKDLSENLSTKDDKNAKSGNMEIQDVRVNCMTDSKGVIVLDPERKEKLWKNC
ncbi:hypothetical protein HELRODRAFT_166824 [Helobdella robusta]|uniref:Uncharacterized protein n=1 Tax=Helobdella robusta TaxID=6412 RepID=T1EYK8_HELRO|nr:hypothetical protein HELRODRAFT_166824 [Helobdella robusta]ESO11782.1 hypothetical protein HELRODRAFT_166824 [Helobdella robusta]